jgi:hypothetical protein
MARRTLNNYASLSAAELAELEAVVALGNTQNRPLRNT